MRMRFLADMGVGQKVVAWLNAQGHDAKHLGDEGLQRLPNGQMFQKAVQEKRIVLTFDLDFGEIVALSNHKSVGVIVFRLHNTTPDNVIGRLTDVLTHSLPALEKGAIVLVEPSRYRIRKLPVEKTG